MTNIIKAFNRNSIRATCQGGQFNTTFGFVRGEATVAIEKGTLVTSKDRYNCYLLITNEFSRHLLLFLFANRKPPVDTVTSFLNIHGIKTDLRRVQIDQGGELAMSSEFRRCIAEAGYTLATTVAGTSF